MKGKKRVHAFKNRMEHWQVVSIGLTVYDAIAMILAFFLALWFRFDCRYTMIPKEYLNLYFKFILIYAVISIFVFRKMRLYNSIWRFASYSELLRTVVATGITFVIHCVGMNVFFGRMPLSYYVFGIMIQFVLTLGVRFSYRFVLLERSRQRKAEEIAKAKKVLLIGAGKAGQMILRDIKTAKELEDIVCCIIDDNPNKWGRYIEGVPVVGGRDDILSCVEQFKIEKIVVAIPSAAAHKHVPLMEDSPCESIKNNAIGTYKTAYAAMMNGCQRFVLISTDKAVNPTNIMGASKRLCEMIVQSFDRMIKEKTPERLPILYAHADDEDGAMVKKHVFSEDIKTEFVAVRFGNVLGSNGSVIPLFKKQIAAGGPVTVTHPDIIRYFMTIPEAVSLVLQAGTYAKGGEIFVLDMGSPVKIDTLARNLIKLSGLKPDIDIKIEYTGLRPGEKLYEEKLMAEEGLKKTPNDLIHIGCPIPFEVEGFLKHLQSLMEMAYANDEHIREKVSEIVTTYHPAGEHGSEKKGEVYERLLGGKTAEK